MRTRAQLEALATFLLSEKHRHQEDIAMINRKLDLLEVQGIVAENEAEWISEEELIGDTMMRDDEPKIKFTGKYMTGDNRCDNCYFFNPDNASARKGYCAASNKIVSRNHKCDEHA